MPENDTIQNGMNDSSATKENVPPPKRKCWWAVASTEDKNWKNRKLSDYNIGEVQTYTLLKEDGKKRLRKKGNFLEAKVGDIVIGYQTGDSEIVALCEICAELNKDDPADKQNIQIIKKVHLKNPITFAELEENPKVRGTEAIRNRAQGAFFKVTQKEAKALIRLIWERNEKDLEGPQKVYLQKVYQQVLDMEDDEYNWDTFLKDVYLGEKKTDDPRGAKEYNTLLRLLKNKKNIILQGPPGVGKTYAAKRLAWSILGRSDEDDPNIQFVQFHQNYSYEDFVMGYKPKSGGGYELQNGVFYEFCKKAVNNPDEDFFLIIDEINRGNTSKIFGELLMLIENDHRDEKVKLAYKKGTKGSQKTKKDDLFSVPKNLYIIGMMNTADRGLAMIDYALRRRFAFFTMKPAFNSEGFEKYYKGLDFKGNEKNIFGALIKRVGELNDEIEKSLGEGFCIGHSYFCGWDTQAQDGAETWEEAKENTKGPNGKLLKKMRDVVECDILPTLREYWFDNRGTLETWEKNLKDVLTPKVTAPESEGGGEGQ